MDEKELDQKIEALANASDKARETMAFLAKAVEALGLRGVEAKKKIIEMAGGVEKFNVSMKRSAADIKKSMDDLKKSINKGEVSAQELSDQLNTLRNEVNKTSDQGKKQALLDAKADLEAMNARNKAHAALKDSVWSLAGTLGAGVTKAFTGAATTALRGGDSFDVATSMMTAGVDLINSANQGSANSLKSFGAATAGAGGKVGMAGRAAGIFGEVLGAASTGLSELAKAGIGFMLAQTKQLIAGFQSMSAAGAVFSGGMTAMTNTALSAYMTLEQFSKSVSANTANLAKSGLGVTEASKRMAGAMQKGGESARNGMFALGMGMEEQADAFATTMALMAGPSGQLKASNAQVAVETQEYAKNLKIISGITGQDAKARMEKVRQDNDTLAFNTVLNSMSETERKKTVEAMALMSDADQRAFREKKIYGDVISTDLAATRATNSGIRKAQDEIFAASEKHALDIQTVGNAYQRNSAETLKKANEDGLSLGRARTGSAVDIAKATNETAQYYAKFADATKVAALVAEEQNKGKTGQGGTAVDLMAQQQEMSVRMQQLAIDNLGSFSTALQKSYEAAMLAVDALGKLANVVTENPWKSLLLSLAVPILSVLAMVGPSLLKGFKGLGSLGGPSAGGPARHAAGTIIDGKNVGGQFKAASATAPTGGIVKSGLNSLKGLAGKAGIAGAVIGTGLAAKDLYDTEQDTTLTKGEKREKQGGIVGGATVGAGGAIAGAKLGASLGVYGGPVGIAIGGLLGAGIGYYIGQKGGEIVGKAIMKDKSSTGTVATATSVAASGATTQSTAPKPVAASGATTQITAPKPVAGTSSQNLAAEQTKLYGAVVDPATAAAKAKAMEKPVASANPAEQQQITLLQTILATLQKSNTISSGILQNSY